MTFETLSEQNARKTRVARYARAMRALGESRVLELSPIASYVLPGVGLLLDMMAGDGFVSRYIGGGFDEIHAIDEAVVPSDKQYSFGRLFQCDAAYPKIPSKFAGKYTRIISLAGFHHLLPPTGDGQLMTDSIEDYRVRCLGRWRELLADGSRLVVGDVPAANESACGLAPLAVPPECHALQEILSGLPHLSVETSCEAKPEPAAFFDDFVSQESITPHVSAFETQASMQWLLERAGFRNVKTAVYLTPWYFGNAREAAWFVHQLFGIDERDFTRPADLPHKFADRVLASVERHLGCGSTESGEFWIGWKLLYAVGDNTK